MESEQCPSFTAALSAGEPVYTKAHPSLADGLAVPKVPFIPIPSVSYIMLFTVKCCGPFYPHPFCVLLCPNDSLQ